jgi:hypothetical protein
MVFVTVAIGVSELCPIRFQFGQREHLVILFLMPYILAVASGTIYQFRAPSCVALGALAGLAVCFKPQQIFVVVCLEILFVFRTRSLKRVFRPELLALTLTGCAYVAAILSFTPPYFKQVVPILRDSYWAFGESNALAFAIHQGRINLAGVILGLALWMATRRSLRMPTISLALLACAFGAALSYDLQHTGWTYQGLPARVFLWLFFSWIGIDLGSIWISRNSSQARLFPALSWSIAVVCALVLLDGAERREARHEKMAQSKDNIANELAKYPANTPAYVFSTGMPEIFPLVLEDKLVWGSRFAHLWMLPAIVKNEPGTLQTSPPFKTLSPNRIAELSSLQRQEMAEDLQFWKPQVVFVEHCTIPNPCQGLEGRDFDLLGWFLQRPAFASEWAHYRKRKTLGTYDEYVLSR